MPRFAPRCSPVWEKIHDEYEDLGPVLNACSDAGLEAWVALSVGLDWLQSTADGGSFVVGGHASQS